MKRLERYFNCDYNNNVNVVENDNDDDDGDDDDDITALTNKLATVVSHKIAQYYVFIKNVHQLFYQRC